MAQRGNVQMATACLTRWQAAQSRARDASRGGGRSAAARRSMALEAQSHWRRIAASAALPLEARERTPQCAHLRGNTEQ